VFPESVAAGAGLRSRTAPASPRSTTLVSPVSVPPTAPLRAAAPETPFFMRVDGTPVYAVFHAAAPGRAGAPVVVHVHGLGVEQITLYRQEVLAARAAAARGFPVLRFHARGHGDSGGGSADVTLGTLVADAMAAADEALRRSGRDRVVWLGVRLGALVTALAGGPGSGRTDAAAFLFWEPVAKPADFFRQQLRTLLFSQVAGGHRPEATVDQLLARLESQGSVDVLGYTLQRSLVQSLAGASLARALTGGRARVMLAQVEARARLSPAHTQLVEALRAGGSDVTTALVQEEPGYQLMSNPAWESEALTRVTMEWLDALGRD
jgi:pimeloyl-ACP methyl ester carboxylesterase